MSAKLEIAVLIGAESKQFLVELQKTVARLEALKGTSSQPVAEHDEESVTPTPAKKTASKKAAPVVEENFDLGEEDDEQTHVISISDVIKACKSNRETAKEVLKKMKVKSVHDLKPDQYGKVIDAIGG